MAWNDTGRDADAPSTVTHHKKNPCPHHACEKSAAQSVSAYMLKRISLLRDGILFASDLGSASGSRKGSRWILGQPVPWSEASRCSGRCFACTDVRPHRR